MPGLGWILKRSLYKEELEPKWPTPDKVRPVQVFDIILKLTLSQKPYRRAEKKKQQQKVLNFLSTLH